MRSRTVDEELTAFCAAEHRDLVGLLALLTGDRWLAEELAQDALTRLCEHWPSVRRMTNPRAWLRRVATNLATSRFRRRAAERRATRRHGVPDDAVDVDTAEAMAVRRAVSLLPRRQRETVVLRWYLGLSVAETAAEMGCADGTVKSLTSKAITNLRTRLHDPEEALR